MRGDAGGRRAAPTEQAWTPKLVEERLAEAADTLRRLPAVKVQGYICSWPTVVRTMHEAYGWHAARVCLGPPSPGAIDRMDETITWLAWLEPDDAKIVWLRASGVRWKLITWGLGIGPYDGVAALGRGVVVDRVASQRRRRATVSPARTTLGAAMTPRRRLLCPLAGQDPAFDAQRP